jgi:alkylation response protein AidB-like acyl-CoA dehydrogenase
MMLRSEDLRRPHAAMINTVRPVVGDAIDVAGGFGIFRRAGLERLFRDARLGRIHPSSIW